MNKDKTKNLKKLLRLFPYIEDKNKAARLKIDLDSIHYISIREDAEKISRIIENYLKKLKIEPNNAIITDATAGVGGNSISFGLKFNKVYSIEIDEQREKYLKNNIDIYDLQNIKTFNEDCTEVIDKIDDHNVIYMDPPWGGKFYKKHKKLRLKIGNLSVETLCNYIFNEQMMKKTPEMIVMKLPINYDLVYLLDTIISKKIYFKKLKKMLIIIIINPKYSHLIIDAIESNDDIDIEDIDLDIEDIEDIDNQNIVINKTDK